MKFKKAFQKDLEEAFEYFKAKEIAAAKDPAIIPQISAYKIEKWVMSMLRKPMYDLIGEKRVNENEHEEAEGDQPG